MVADVEIPHEVPALNRREKKRKKTLGQSGIELWSLDLPDVVRKPRKANHTKLRMKKLICMMDGLVRTVVEQ